LVRKISKSSGIIYIVDAPSQASNSQKI